MSYITVTQLDKDQRISIDCCKDNIIVVVRGVANLLTELGPVYTIRTDMKFVK